MEDKKTGAPILAKAGIIKCLHYEINRSIRKKVIEGKQFIPIYPKSWFSDQLKYIRLSELTLDYKPSFCHISGVIEISIVDLRLTGPNATLAALEIPISKPSRVLTQYFPAQESADDPKIIVKFVVRSSDIKHEQRVGRLLMTPSFETMEDLPDSSPIRISIDPKAPYKMRLVDGKYQITPM
ncbi:TPA_asm: P3 [Begonia betacytorhabdovirus 1]|nr:TPA_asm: P3 [Begonia betacytorhabdovirus 1]